MKDAFKKENINHSSVKCDLENLEENDYHKKILYNTKLKIRDFYLKNRNLSPRDILYQCIKWEYTCSIPLILDKGHYI